MSERISSKKWTYHQMMTKKLVCSINKPSHGHNGYCFEVESNNRSNKV